MIWTRLIPTTLFYSWNNNILYALSTKIQTVTVFLMPLEVVNVATCLCSQASMTLDSGYTVTSVSSQLYSLSPVKLCFLENYVTVFSLNSITWTTFSLKPNSQVDSNPVQSHLNIRRISCRMANNSNWVEISI